MFPAFLVRSGIDWVRNNKKYKDSNPYTRCEATVKLCTEMWEESMGKADIFLLEPATVTAYWSEFFHAENPMPDEVEWREGLIKRSGQYDSFEDWQEWFKKQYANIYKDDNTWISLLMTAWAHTHQYEVLYNEDSWEFRPATSYLPTSEIWRLEPHLTTIAHILREIWHEEVAQYEDAGFSIDELGIPYLGKIEGLGFDTKKYLLVWPPHAQKEKEPLQVGEMVADIILPIGDSWYRHLDNVIFANQHVDITALANRAKYVFGSRRRLIELTADNGIDKAKMQASAEGWLVPEIEESAV